MTVDLLKMVEYGGCSAKIPAKQLRFYDPESGNYKIMRGGYSVLSGSSSSDLPFTISVDYDN